jgi:hypothetical protein
MFSATLLAHLRKLIPQIAIVPLDLREHSPQPPEHLNHHRIDLEHDVLLCAPNCVRRRTAEAHGAEVESMLAE